MVFPTPLDGAVDQNQVVRVLDRLDGGHLSVVRAGGMAQFCRIAAAQVVAG